MGMHIAILPDADRGMPRWGVAPIHVQGARIGIRASLAVAQRKRASDMRNRRRAHRRRDFVSGHPQSAMGTRGSASGAPIRVRANAFRTAEQGAGPAEPRLAEMPRRRDVSNVQIVQSIIEKGIE